MRSSECGVVGYVPDASSVSAFCIIWRLIKLCWGVHGEVSETDSSVPKTSVVFGADREMLSNEGGCGKSGTQATFSVFDVAISRQRV